MWKFIQTCCPIYIGTITIDYFDFGNKNERVTVVKNERVTVAKKCLKFQDWGYDLATITSVCLNSR